MAKKIRKKVSTAQEALHERVMKELQSFKNLSSGTTFTKTNFLKRKKGDNIFRIVRPISGPVCLPFKQHKGFRFNNFFTAVNLDFVFNEENEEFRTEMEARERIDEEDYELWAELGGDPFKLCFKALQAYGKEKLWQNIGQQRVWFVYVQDDEAGVFDASPSFNEQFVDLYEENPHIMELEEGQDINTKGKGEGFGKANSRRYNPPILVGEPYALEIDEEDLPNLYDAIAGKVFSYADKVDFLFESHPKLRAAAQLDYDDFGLEPPPEEDEEEDDDDPY